MNISYKYKVIINIFLCYICFLIIFFFNFAYKVCYNNEGIEALASNSTDKRSSKMISVSDLKAGMTFILDGKLWRVLEISHHKPGKGNTIMRMKIRDVRNNSTVDTTMRPDEKVERAHIDTKDVQYLYSQDSTAFFMDLETYDQYEIAEDAIERELKFLLENAEAKIQFYGSEVIGVQLPSTVVLQVTETQPSIKGATVSGSGKPATMETGLVVNVPDFIEAGEYLVVNTAEGTYSGRANK